MLRGAPLAKEGWIERDGVPYQVVREPIDGIFDGTVTFQTFVHSPKADSIKKMREESLCAGTNGQSAPGVTELINRVEDMLAAEPDRAEAGTFDVERWVGDWIQRPQPALGGRAPAEVMDTPAGRDSVMRLLSAIQSGAYQ